MNLNNTGISVIEGRKSKQIKNISVQILKGPASVSDFSKDWDDLFNRAIDAPVFLSRPWLTMFIEEERINGEPIFVLCWFQKKLVALFALSVRKYLGTKIAEPVGTFQPSYLGLLVDSDYPEAIGFIAEEFKAGDIADMLCIENLSSEDKATNAFLAQLANKNFHVYSVRRNPCLFIRLGCSYEEYLQKNKSGKSRQTLRRKEKILQKKHTVEIEKYNAIEVTDKIIERIALIQEQSWMKRRGAAVLGLPFYRELLLTAARSGLARAWLMKIDGNDAAFVFALVAHEQLHYAWTAFKLEYVSSLSVGQFLTSRVIHDACEDGILVFNFGHGDADYKRFWSTDKHFVYRAVAGRGLMGRIFSFLYYISWRLKRVKAIRMSYLCLKSLPQVVKKKINMT